MTLFHLVRLVSVIYKQGLQTRVAESEVKYATPTPDSEFPKFLTLTFPKFLTPTPDSLA